MEEKNTSLRRQIAALESQLDQYESEFGHLDEILRKCGFPNGIKTLKSTVEELLTETNHLEE